MWMTLPLQTLPLFPSVCFHTCIYGGLRPKLTKLLYHGLDLSPLHLLCDDLHQHFPWRVQGPSGPEFQTAINELIPKIFCKAVVQLVLHSCLSQGFHDVPQSLSSSSTIGTPLCRHCLRGGVGVQPRGRQLAVLPNGCNDLWIPSNQLTSTSFCPEVMIHRVPDFPLTLSLRTDQKINVKYKIRAMISKSRF